MPVGCLLVRVRGREDCGFRAFFDSVDALVMGRGTWDLVRTFPEWPYGTKPVVVLSSRPVDIPEARELRIILEPMPQPRVSVAGIPEWLEVIAEAKEQMRRRNKFTSFARGEITR